MNFTSHAKPRTSKGFTLVEVLVALVLIGLTLPALSFRVQSILDNASYIDEKTVAYWVAESTYQEVILQHNFEQALRSSAPTPARSGSGSDNDRKKPLKKPQKDKVEFASLEWQTRVEWLETEVDRITRVEVSVGLEEGNNLATISGFLYE